MPGDVTQLLSAIDSGDPKAAAELLPLVYDELRRLAARKMAQEKPGQTLQATALVHEGWLRVAGSDRQQWRGRQHFFGAAAEAMRRILIENARRRACTKRGGNLERVDLEELPISAPERDETVTLPGLDGRLFVRATRSVSLVHAPPRSAHHSPCSTHAERLNI